MQLLREVDFKQTRCNARDVLKNFRRLERMAGRSLIDIKSPIITDMPKAPKHGNKAEDAIIQMMDIEAERDAILAALMAGMPGKFFGGTAVITQVRILHRQNL